jgi:hypothetical protein
MEKSVATQTFNTAATRYIVGPSGAADRVFIFGVELIVDGATNITLSAGSQTILVNNFSAAGSFYRAYALPLCTAKATGVSIVQSGTAAVTARVWYLKTP